VIPVSAPSFVGNEKSYVDNCLSKGWISQGEWVKQFEANFATYCGTKHAVSCSSGTAALHLMLLGLNLGRQDAVLIPALTYVATANAVEYCGATPVFCDISTTSWTLDPRHVRKMAIEARGRGLNVRAIIAVHLFGTPADMEGLRVVADEFNAVLLEDAAQAHGARVNGIRVGAVGDAAAFSFYANKIITTGEGGMVTTNDDDLAARMRLYRGQGQSEQRFVHEVIGYNYRMTDMAAAVGSAQLEQIERFIGQRSVLANHYRYLFALKGLNIGTQSLSRVTDRAVDWLMSVQIPEESLNILTAQHLKSKGIETRPFFVPLPYLPPYAHHYCPRVTQKIAERGLSLPLHYGMTEEEVEFVVNTLEEVL
jgi:perosamine synthetase